MKGITAANRRLAQWRVTWLIEHSTSHQLLWFIDCFVLRNPPLRKAPKRYAVKYQTVYDKKKVIKNGSTELWNYAEKLIEDSVEKGILEK